MICYQKNVCQIRISSLSGHDIFTAYFINISNMKSKGSKNDKKYSKSAQKKHNIKMAQLNLLLYKNNQLQQRPYPEPQHNAPQSQIYQKITDRSKTRSCLGGYISSNKTSMELLNAAKKTSVSGWINQQLQTTRLEKRSSNCYEYIQVIGKGGFGKVYKVREKKTGHHFAMKEMSKAVILAKKSNESIRNQRHLLRVLKNKFIINMRQAFQDRDTLYLVMDLMPGGDLRYHICRKHKFTEQQTRFFAACIFSGLEYMHFQKIIHRDIKPENLVFDDKGYIHLTDLGIAKEFRQENSTDTSGTPGYMAPQVMTKQNHSYQVDYYALGVIVYELMMGKRPYMGRDRKSIREQIMAKQSAVKKDEIPEGWSIQAADFVNKLIQRRPKARLGWGGSHELKNHAWLRDFPWDKLMESQLQSPFKAHCKYNPEDVRYQPTKEDEEMSNLIKQNKMLLRKNTVQLIFEGYTFNEDVNKEEENQTTSSQFYKKRERFQMVDI